MAKKRPTTRSTSRSNTSATQEPGELRGLDAPAAPGAVKTALIRGNTFAARAVQYVEIDGLAIFEGDIVLGTAEEMEQQTEQMRAEMASGVASGVVISGSQFRWPNCRVPFTIDPALPNQARVTNAIAHWEANTRFRFVARTTEADFVTFRPGSGCSAHVGRRGGQQFVNLGTGCSLGNVIHEIGHVVGLWHEQSREDRDLFVRINWGRITAGMEHNFNQHITDGDDVGPYDFGSIMHYPRNAFSVDGSDTITPIVALPPGITLGQRTTLSPQDIATANSMCPKVVKEAPKDPLKEVRKEILKEIPRDTRKEQIKDVRIETRKELITDTLKEQIRDPIPKPRDVVLPRPATPGLGAAGGGAMPFAVATSQSPASAGDAPSLDVQIQELDAQLLALADQLAQTEGSRQMLQEQYDETAALLAQLMQEHAQDGR